MEKKFENIILPEGSLLVTHLPGYYKPKSDGIDLTSAVDRKYSVGVIEFAGADFDDDIPGCEVFYYRGSNPLVVDIKGVGVYDVVTKDSVILVDISNIINSKSENDGKI